MEKTMFLMEKTKFGAPGGIGERIKIVVPSQASLVQTNASGNRVVIKIEVRGINPVGEPPFSAARGGVRWRLVPNRVLKK